MNYSSLPDPAALAYSDFATFRHPLPSNRHIDVLISVTMILNQDGRFQNNVAINLYTILGRHETPGADYGTIVDDQNWFALFIQRYLHAKDSIFLYNHGRAQFDSMGVGPGQIRPEMNG
jgi:hypothetical protein